MVCLPVQWRVTCLRVVYAPRLAGSLWTFTSGTPPPSVQHLQSPCSLAFPSPSSTRTRSAHQFLADRIESRAQELARTDGGEESHQQFTDGHSDGKDRRPPWPLRQGWCRRRSMARRKAAKFTARSRTTSRTGAGRIRRTATCISLASYKSMPCPEMVLVVVAKR